MKLHMDVLRRLPGARRAQHNVRLPCPIHQAGRTDGDSLAVAQGSKGPVWHCFAGCDANEVRDALIALGVLERTRPPIEENDMPEQNEWMYEVWRNGTELTGSTAFDYLKSRGITVATALDAARQGRVLRQRQAGRGWELLAKISNIHGDMIGLHRTCIDQSGTVTKRRCHGVIKGGAIRLFRGSSHIMIDPVGKRYYTQIVIAEGIETAMSWRQLNPTADVWSVISANGISTIDIPHEVQHIVVAADFDGPSITAYEKLKRRVPDTISVELSLPEEYETDWNDVLKARGATKRQPG